MLLCDFGHSFVFLAWKTKEKIKRNHIKLQVMWDEKFPEHGELATLFGFGNTSLPSSTKYMGMCEPLPATSLLYPPDLLFQFIFILLPGQ